MYVAAGLLADLEDKEFDQPALMFDAGRRKPPCAIIVGGDMSSSQRLWLSVTVVGYADSAERIRRAPRAGIVADNNGRALEVGLVPLE